LGLDIPCKIKVVEDLASDSMSNMRDKSLGKSLRIERTEWKNKMNFLMNFSD